ncbi:STAS domain-containing protein [Fibrobacter sp.]|uniref:STAS domain-containing protein n=1 Tax=Fibrobacter sp. TaxID=35828 RepID=UPI0025C37670|nr:STAS domain-containing protein [Fibrobacter sp.]MBR3070712.1 STAS domain-containing protein [Fibrobacter sp.]
MEIKSNLNGEELTVELSGELNAMTAPQLSTFLAPHLENIKSLIFDFKECDFVSSAGIRVLLSSFKTLKKNQGDMRLENVGPNFKEVLEATGLDVAFGIL